jgi:hypothetical protein
MRTIKNKLLIGLVSLLAGVGTVQAFEYCWLCEREYRSCLRSGTNGEVCEQQRSQCFAWNGCFAD